MGQPYCLLPFKFERFEDKFFVVNEVGEFNFLNPDEFVNLINYKLDKNSSTFLNLKAKQLLTDTDLEPVIEMLATKYRTKKSFLRDFTSLHMVVPTLRCNSKCIYCQVSSKDSKDERYDMDKITAQRIVETIFCSPSSTTKIEFQGGEPLLRFDLVSYIIEYANLLNLKYKKNLQFVICTNLSLIDENQLTFFNKYNVLISTSLDGHKELHEKNRPLRNLNNGHDIFIEKLALVRKMLGINKISALMTTTKDSLSLLPKIIDEYITNGFHSIFIRMLNPYGLAAQHNSVFGYGVDEFFDAYKKALDYIVQLNLKGQFFVEEFARLLLTRILTPFSTGFVDFQSPAGVGISGVIYNYNGNVYVSDEGRMLAAMGDDKFLMGNVNSNTYEEIFHSDFLQKLLKHSCLECLPVCSYCPYQSYCGADPVRNYVEQGDIIGNRFISKVCQKNKMIIGHVLKLIKNGGEDVNEVFWSWITNRSLEEIKNGGHQ